MGIIPMKLFYNQYRSSGRDVVSRKKSIFSSGGLFIQWSRTIYVILVDSITGYIQAFFAFVVQEMFLQGLYMQV